MAGGIDGDLADQRSRAYTVITMRLTTFSVQRLQQRCGLHSPDPKRPVSERKRFQFNTVSETPVRRDRQRAHTRRHSDVG